MTIVAFTGDLATTTTIATAAAWNAPDEMVVFEADMTGGDLAAWFDMSPTPSLSTLVTTVRDGGWDALEPLVRVSPAGLRLVPAPARLAEARQAVRESTRVVVPALATSSAPIVFADVGHTRDAGVNPFLGAAAAIVVIHRQSPQSPRAAAVRLQRLAEALGPLTDGSHPIVVALVGSRPFSGNEVASFLSESVGDLRLVELPIDELAAAVFGGRTGVNARRLNRLPLLHAAHALVAAIDLTLDRQPSGSQEGIR